MARFRPKKVMVTNNKGGVGKTTLCYNLGVELARKGLSVALVDLDPQCNLTLQALKAGEVPPEGIGAVIRPQVEGTGDIDLSVEPMRIRNDYNLWLVPGSIDLTVFESALLSGFTAAIAGEPRGYTMTSAISRYLNHIAKEFDIDVMLMDTSPSLGVLNRVIFLSSDMFFVPIAADSFSVQGVDNLGKVLTQWKKQWKATAVYLGQDTSASRVLAGDPLFIGYIENGYNVYSGRIVKRQRDWLDEIPQHVRHALSLQHGRNGLVEESWKTPLGEMRDLGQLTAISMKKHVAIQELSATSTPELNLQGTKQLWNDAKTLLSKTADRLIDLFENN